MVWLVLLGGIQILGFGLTLTRLAYDEWQQWRGSERPQRDLEDPADQMEFEQWSIAATT